MNAAVKVEVLAYLRAKLAEVRVRYERPKATGGDEAVEELFTIGLRREDILLSAAILELAKGE